MPLRDHWWCILVAKYGAFLFTEIGAFVITDYNKPQTDERRARSGVFHRFSALNIEKSQKSSFKIYKVLIKNPVSKKA
jgi:hypothetical protein